MKAQTSKTMTTKYGVVVHFNRVLDHDLVRSIFSHILVEAPDQIWVVDENDFFTSPPGRFRYHCRVHVSNGQYPTMVWPNEVEVDIVRMDFPVLLSRLATVCHLYSLE